MQFRFHDQAISVNIADRGQLATALRSRFDRGEGFTFATINLDHLVKLTESEGYARIYAAQDLVVADGRPIVWLSRLAGAPVDLLPGSDLVYPLAGLAAESGVRVALLGSTPQALADARRCLSEAYPDIDIALTISPPMGFDPEGDEAVHILERLARERIGLCFVALGAPKQEVLALRGRKVAPGVGFASVGAGLEFLGGHQVRAPRWMRRLALEWLWRAGTNPRRLLPRYAKCIAILPGQMIRALRQRFG